MQINGKKTRIKAGDFISYNFNGRYMLLRRPGDNEASSYSEKYMLNCIQTAGDFADFVNIVKDFFNLRTEVQDMNGKNATCFKFVK